MKSKLVGISAALSLAGATLLAPAAVARGYNDRAYEFDSGPYIGGSVGELVYDEDGLETLYPSAFVFRLGVPLGRYIGLEGRLGTGLSDTHTWVDGERVEVGIDSLWGGYLKGSLPLSPQFSIYGVAGVAHTRLSVKSFGESGTTSDSSFSFGFGGDFALNRDISLNVDWTRTMRSEFDTYTGDLLTVGVNWHL